jgi:DNA-binding LacI/PurR family transcriptional regulator
MPSRKAEQIIKILRDEILSGKRTPGEKLPTYDALMEQFQVTRPTIARVLDGLRGEGLVTVNGTRGVFIADRFPHHNRYFWVTSEQPGSLEWTSFLATILDLIEKKETGIQGEVVALVGVDGRQNNPEYQRLCEAVEHGSVAGLLLMNSATVYLLPVLQTQGVPRVAIWAPLPHAALLRLDFPALIDRACQRMLEKGKRIAVVSPHAYNLDATQKRFSELGLAAEKLWALHVAPVGCERITELLFDRPDRPDALFVTDDNLVEPLVRGLRRAKVQAGRDVYVLAHCNWPRPFGIADGVEHIGFDAREVLLQAKECIDAQRAGEPSPTRIVRPRFKTELMTFTSAASEAEVEHSHG